MQPVVSSALIGGTRVLEASKPSPFAKSEFAAGHSPLHSGSLHFALELH